MALTNTLFLHRSSRHKLAERGNAPPGNPQTTGKLSHYRPKAGIVKGISAKIRRLPADNPQKGGAGSWRELHPREDGIILGLPDTRRNLNPALAPFVGIIGIVIDGVDPYSLSGEHILGDHQLTEG